MSIKGSNEFTSPCVPNLYKYNQKINCKNILHVGNLWFMKRTWISFRMGWMARILQIKEPLKTILLLVTFMVLSPDAETIYLSSKSTTLTAARWPTSTRRSVMSLGDCKSQTAIERSYEWKDEYNWYLHQWFNTIVTELIKQTKRLFEQFLQ